MSNWLAEEARCDIFLLGGEVELQEEESCRLTRSGTVPLASRCSSSPAV